MAVGVEEGVDGVARGDGLRLRHGRIEERGILAGRSCQGCQGGFVGREHRHAGAGGFGFGAAVVLGRQQQRCRQRKVGVAVQGQRQALARFLREVFARVGGCGL